jgi:hypothetical protein
VTSCRDQAGRHVDRTDSIEAHITPREPTAPSRVITARTLLRMSAQSRLEPMAMLVKMLVADRSSAPALESLRALTQRSCRSAAQPVAMRA